MSGVPLICKPWIGQLLYGDTSENITLEEFQSKWSADEEDLIHCNSSSMSAAKTLLDSANSRGMIDLSKVKDLASRVVPPVNFCVPDLGLDGPILGTIHASKAAKLKMSPYFWTHKLKNMPTFKHKKKPRFYSLVLRGQKQT